MSGCADVVVLLPGITGSALANSKGKEVWGASAGVVWRAVKSRGDSIEDLALAANGEPGGVTATRLIPDITIVPGLVKIDGYTKIERYLIEALGLKRGENYFAFPYDWRLDNRVNARRLLAEALGRLHDWRKRSGNADAKLVLIGHSMGGLVSRYFVECLGGWKDTRRLITIGTPHWGSLNAVDFLVHGMKKGIGPFGLDLTPVLRSLPSIYQLLPSYACIDVNGPALQGVAEAAKAAHLPFVDELRARDALAFHAEIEDAQKHNAGESAYTDYRLVPLVGVEQPTSQSARCRSGKVELLRSMNGKDDGGDGTVPRVSATPFANEQDSGATFAAEIHGSLQNADAILTIVKGTLTAPDVELKRLRYAGLGVDLSLDIDDVVMKDEPLTVRARVSEGNPPISVRMTNTNTNEVVDDQLALQGDSYERQYQLPSGVWRVTISAPNATPVTDLAVVAES